MKCTKYTLPQRSLYNSSIKTHTPCAQCNGGFVHCVLTSWNGNPFRQPMNRASTHWILVDDTPTAAATTSSFLVIIIAARTSTVGPHFQRCSVPPRCFNCCTLNRRISSLPIWTFSRRTLYSSPSYTNLDTGSNPTVSSKKHANLPVHRTFCGGMKHAEHSSAFHWLGVKQPSQGHLFWDAAAMRAFSYASGVCDVYTPSPAELAAAEAGARAASVLTQTSQVTQSSVSRK